MQNDPSGRKHIKKMYKMFNSVYLSGGITRDYVFLLYSSVFLNFSIINMLKMSFFKGLINWDQKS